MTAANDGIKQDGFDAAFAGAPETEHDYSSPHLLFQRFSWLTGYAEGLGALQEFQRECQIVPTTQEAAKKLLSDHRLCSAIPASERTPWQNDIAQMGRKRLERVANETSKENR